MLSTTLLALGLTLGLVACGAAEPSAGTPVARPAEAPSRPVDEPSSRATQPPSQGMPAHRAPPTPPRPELPVSSRFVAERSLEANVLFLEAGAGDRLAVLADAAGVVTPHRFENGSWQVLPLPASARSAVGQSSLGIFFGRDNRPRLMGYRSEGASRRMVYLRHRDGVWQDQRSEIGALASDASVLFGVLGDADPEVVCKVGGICLLKSRRGWKELANTLPETAVVRTFAGTGYALTADGVFAAGDTSFARVGPPPPWRSEATGFFVGAGGTVLVVEPGADAIHTLEGPTAAWRTESSPVAAPRDILGPPGDRWIGGDGGLAHEEGGAFTRVGDPVWRIARIVSSSRGTVAAGPSGVVVVRPVAAP